MKVEFSPENQERELYVGLSTEELRKLLEGEQIKYEQVEIKKNDLNDLVRCDLSGEHPDMHFSIGLGKEIIHKMLLLPLAEDIYLSEHVSERLGPYRSFFYHLAGA